MVSTRFSKFPSYDCGACGAQFKKYEQLTKHKRELMAAGEGHLHCEICGVEFGHHIPLVIHHQECHSTQKELNCPGCNKSLKLVGDLVGHLDNGDCPKISKCEWLAYRKEKINAVKAKDEPNFTRFIDTTEAGSTGAWEQSAFQLDSAHFDTAGPFEGVDQQYFPALPEKPKDNAAPGAAVLKITLPTREVKPIATPNAQGPKDDGASGKDSDPKKDTENKENQSGNSKPAPKQEKAEKKPFKPVGTRREARAAAKAEAKSKALISKTSTSKPIPIPTPAPTVNAWGQKKNLFPDAPPPQRPTAQQLEIAGAAHAKTKYLHGIHDPNHPHYTVEKYLESNGRYQCPMDACIYTFATAEGLTHHLEYLGEHGGKKARCPGCQKLFKTASALAHHAQMSGGRCSVKESGHYGQFVDEVSAGLVRAEGVNDDDTTKYKVTDEAAARFGGGRKVEKAEKADDDDFYADVLEGLGEEDLW